MVAKLDENQNIIRFGQIYGEGLDYTFTFFDYCGNIITKASSFNSLLKTSEVYEQNLENFNAQLTLFGNFNFAECTINSLTINLLFHSGANCPLSLSDTNLDININLDKYQQIKNKYLIIDSFNG